MVFYVSEGVRHTVIRRRMRVMERRAGPQRLPCDHLLICTVGDEGADPRVTQLGAGARLPCCERG
jgi:hypothetical protein